MRDGEQQPNVG